MTKGVHMTDFPQDYERFELGDFRLQHGATLRGAQLAYKTFGELNAEKSNVIVCPTWYSGRHWDNEWMIGEGMALDPTKYFIVIPDMLGNGVSSSPSNMPPPYDRAQFPNVTFYDQVEAQHKLLTERYGIERVALVTGRSEEHTPELRSRGHLVCRPLPEKQKPGRGPSPAPR